MGGRLSRTLFPVGAIMAWSRLNEDRAAADEPWSAFLLKGLIDNANAYATDLAPGFSAVWRADRPPMWASMEAYAGGLVTFNVGQRATEVDLVLSIASHPTLVGYLKVYHPATDAFSTATIPAGATTVTVSVAFGSPQSGPQEFQLLYRSSVAEESIGHFHCFTAIGNQIAVRNDGNIFTVAANAGRQFWALQLTGSNVDDGQPIPPGGFHWYQIGRVNPILNVGGGQHADGYLITWPDVETNPPILRSTSTFIQQAPNYVQGDIFELSFLALYSVSLRVTATAGSLVPMLYAHDLAQSVSNLPRAQRLFAGSNQIQVAACPAMSQEFLGAVVTPDKPLLKIYSQEETGAVSLVVRLRAMAFEPAGGTPSLTLDLVEVAPGGFFNVIRTITIGEALIPLARPRRSFADPAFVHLALTGVNYGRGEWGLGDAALALDLDKAPLISTELNFTAERWSNGYFYAIQINTTVPIYVSAFYVGGA